MTYLNLEDFERAAAERLEPGPLGYFAGGAGDERTLRDNVAGWRRLRLRPRVLVDVGDVRTATTVLGTDVSMPVLVAPTALHRMLHPDGEPAVARAAAAAGTIMTLSTLATCRPGELAASAPVGPRWFQVYVLRDRGITRALVDEAVEHGFSALVLTVDAPRAGRRERDLRSGFAVPPDVRMPAVEAALGSDVPVTPVEFFDLVDRSVSWSAVEELASIGLPVVIKGIHTAEDAVLAAEHGARAVVVSNHGGRQLDGVAATADVLPEVVEAVASRLEVLVDGGVRRGTDVVAALALGARAVLVGRPVLWGLACGGQDGVTQVLELLRAEVELALTLLGTPAPGAVTRAHVRRAPAVG